MNRIAEFKKVSPNQFIKDFGDEEELNLEEASRILGNLSLPQRSTTGSAGYDFISTKDAILNPGDTTVFPTGIRCHIKEGWFLMICPRSGLGFKYRAQLDNTVGIIDSDYFGAKNEGHIMIKITNDSKSNKVMVIKAGDKIAQGIFLPYGITVDDEAEGERTGGFGSTGQ